jgi:hypothetical protein
MTVTCIAILVSKFSRLYFSELLRLSEIHIRHLELMSHCQIYMSVS